MFDYQDEDKRRRALEGLTDIAIEGITESMKGIFGVSVGVVVLVSGEATIEGKAAMHVFCATNIEDSAAHKVIQVVERKYRVG